MRSVLAASVTALLLVSCTSGAAPGSGEVVEQVEKARDLEEQVEERNSELAPTP